MGDIILVRHTEVSSNWKKRCYGVTDVPLSNAGQAAIKSITSHLAKLQPQSIIHSGVSRTTLLAKAISLESNIHITEDKAFQELNFGSWEGCFWTDIFLSVGHDMGRLVSEPDIFSPPQGETLYSMRDRVIKALLRIPNGITTIVITHGGPIGAVSGTLRMISAKDWPSLVPDYGSTLALNKTDLLRLHEIMKIRLLIQA
ncbi:MAG: phosphoglycerate mutase GpmB [Hyphomicrobiaceae bacterium hypho_1]